MPNQDGLQQLLLKLRTAFLEELPDRLHKLDGLLLAMEKSGAPNESYNEIYRIVHSLKGNGGTLGLHIITIICHQLEDQLARQAARGEFGKKFTDHCLAYVDLLRQAVEEIRQGKESFPQLEQQLNELREKVTEKRHNVLLVDNSKLSLAMYGQALKNLPVNIIVMEDAYQALLRLLTEPFDLLITANELPLLSGLAMIGAVRLSSSPNRQIKAILVTSNKEVQSRMKRQTDASLAIAKDARLPERLREEVGKLFG